MEMILLQFLQYGQQQYSTIKNLIEFSHKANMYLQVLVIITYLIQYTINQQRQCIYTDSSNSQFINLQHQLIQFQTSTSAQTCTPCLPYCLTCTSSNDQTCANGNCQSKYYFNTQTNKCQRCNNLCEVCKDGLTCQDCIDGYYLNIYGKCQACLNGVRICTGSATIQCYNGFYYDSQTYLCRACPVPYCKSCATQTYCSLCQSGYLLNNDGSACLSCRVDNCHTCLNIGVCISCQFGYKLQSNSKCVVQNCTSINKCKSCINSSGTLLCTLCESQFFLLDNKCYYGASMMCGYSLTSNYIKSKQWSLYPTNSNSNNYIAATDYGSCATCNPNRAKQGDYTQTYCIPSQINRKKQTLADYFMFNKYTICTVPYMTVSQPNRKLQFIYQMQTSYLMNIQAIMIIYNITNSIANFTNVNQIFDPVINLNGNLLGSNMEIYPLYCTNPTLVSSFILKLNLQYKLLTEYTNTQSNATNLPLQSLNLTLNLKSNLTSQFTTISKKQIYLTLKLCLVDNCLQCLSETACTKCKYPYFIQNYICVLKCDIGYYMNKVSRKCLSQCQKGYYYDVMQSEFDNLCVVCPSGCTICTNMTFCTECKTGFFLTQDNKCLQNCSTTLFSYYYPNFQENICKKCENPCKTCSLSPKNCTSCLIGFLYKNLSTADGTCLFECPLSYYSKVIVQENNLINPKCINCNISCLSCYLDSNLCTACKLGSYLWQNTCVNICPIGYFGFDDNIQFEESPYCKACSKPCSECLGFDNNCTKCQLGMYLFVLNTVGKCLMNCPTDLYFLNKSSKMCTPCSDINCKLCSIINIQNQKQICSECLNGYVLENDSCVIYCSNAWSVSGKCQQCPYPCSRCTGTSINNYTCISCHPAYYYYYEDPSKNGSCHIVCPNGTYPNWTNYQCDACPQNCILCMLTINSFAVQCLSCNSSYILSNYSCVLQAQGCLVSTFLPQNSSICQNCREDCVQCKDKQFYCTKCQVGKFLLQYSGQCLITCLNGYFADMESKLCKKCQSTCSQCVTFTNCTACLLDYYLYYNSNSLSYTCININQCNSFDKYYINRFNNTCLKCKYPCSDCTSQLICITCVNQTYLYRNNCVSQCSIGYFANPVQHVCKQCPRACESCLNLTYCDNCKPSYFYRPIFKQCVQSCPSGEFNSKQTMMCENCREPCATCLNYQYCLSCVTILEGVVVSLILLNGQCISSCPQGFYMMTINTIKHCLPCNQSCKVCQSNQICTSCNYGYYLYNFICLKAPLCPTFYYPDQNTRSCGLCIPPCLTCKARFKCLTCITGHFFKQQYCYARCPVGTYQNNTLCLDCPSNCTRCQSQQTCLSCKAGLFLNIASNSAYCTANCPSNTYIQISTSKCQPCGKTCKTCFRHSNNCTSCPSDKTLQNSACLLNCTNNYYQIQHTTQNDNISRECKMCNTSCSQCLGIDICLQCDSSYLFTSSEIVKFNNKFYHKSYCMVDCPIGTFKNPQNFTCQVCQQGCINCLSLQLCLSCSDSEGYILYNIKCLRNPCPSHLYTITSQNRCVQKQYCLNNPTKYYIYTKQKQCYSKHKGCADHLVYKNYQQCIDKCTQGYIVDFNRKCIQNNQTSGVKFNVILISMQGYIQILIGFQGYHVGYDCSDLFMNVTISEGLTWKDTQNLKNARLLTDTSQQFTVSKPLLQQYQNMLSLYLIPSSPILTPTDYTINVTMKTPYTNLLQFNNFPLQNYFATSKISSYKTQTIKSQNQIINQKKQFHPLSIIIIILTILITLANMLKSKKIYLLIPIYDCLHFIYSLAYIDVNWGKNMNQFIKTLQIVWINFKIQLGNKQLILGSQKIYSTIGNLNLLNNIVSNIIVIGVIILIFGICKLIKNILEHKDTLRQKQKQANSKIIKKQQPIKSKQSNKSDLAVNMNSPVQNVKISRNTRILGKICEIQMKLIMGICYLCIPNIFFFSLLNIQYADQIYANKAVILTFSILLIIVIAAGIFYLTYQITINKNKQILDSGINIDKKSIIINLPIYLFIRKLLFVLFIVVYPQNSPFALVFGLISTAFIFVLICWFQPFYSKSRYTLLLCYELGLALLFLFCFIYVCNQRQMASGGFTSFLIFLINVIWILAASYPVYHLYVLFNGRKIVNKLIYKIFHISELQQNKQKQNRMVGYCMEQIRNQIQSSQQSLNSSSTKKDHHSHKTQQNSQKQNTKQLLIKQKEKFYHIKQEQQENRKKIRIIKIPKNKIAEGQTNYQADQSQQQSIKNKINFPDYTVRLTKRAVPEIKIFKHYDVDMEENGNDQEGLTQKQIHLHKLLEKQKNYQGQQKNQLQNGQKGQGN